MHELRYNSVNTVPFGPIVSVSDGTTPVETLDLDAADSAELLTETAASSHSIGSSSLSTAAAAPGFYWVILTASNCSALGRNTMAIADNSLIVPYSKDFMVVNEYEWDRKYGSVFTGVHSGMLTGVPWYGSVASITDSTISLTGHNLAPGRLKVSLTGGSSATGRDRFGSLSGASITVDPAWTADSETLPSGTITAYVTPAPKNTVSTIATVDVAQIDGSSTAATNLSDAFDGTGYDSSLTVFIKDSIATISGNVNISTDIAALNDIDGSVVTVAPGSVVSANIQKINDVTIVGDGSGTPFTV